MKQFTTSLCHAWQGIRSFVFSERNGRIQLAFGLIAVLLGALLHIEAMQWLIIVICIGFVLSLEFVNSAVELLADIVQPRYDNRIKALKDMLAGAVLLASLVSVIAGTVIFFPYIKQLLNTSI